MKFWETMYIEKYEADLHCFEGIYICICKITDVEKSHGKWTENYLNISNALNNFSIQKILKIIFDVVRQQRKFDLVKKNK